MDFDVIGRLGNLHLSPSNHLLPLFEAVVNSIQAIQAVDGRRDGRISIEILRDETRPPLDFDEDSMRAWPISGFVVTDNGIGFNDDGYKAFCTSDTTFKRVIGGKGGQADLARYVVHRRTVLNLLEKSLQMGPDGRYEREEVVHNIIYPMHKTSDELDDFEGQNLWIIDERLCYHSYLASDKRMSQMPMLSDGKSARPDIVVFNKRFAYVEADSPYSSVVIIEFKRPIRDDYSDSDNPVNQVYDYVRDIRSGSQRDHNGRPIDISDSTRFYCYIIADLTDALKRQAENAVLCETHDEMGYFGVNPLLNTYVELISFGKLISDAKKRNRVLFDKLNLPQ